MTTYKQLEKQCQSIANDLSNGIEVTEDNVDYYPDLSIGDNVSGHDYLSHDTQDDWTYTISRSGDYRSGEVAMALGGPSIWINTNTRTVEGYWGSDRVTIPYIDNIGLDDALCEFYECGIGMNLNK
jgi:hypothetical protein